MSRDLVGADRQIDRLAGTQRHGLLGGRPAIDDDRACDPLAPDQKRDVETVATG
ncbi:hypothetical protein QP185_07825 [Sphingomonas aerolata]|uniref:hypothetical protein n=1 Tax=Sphingomonas aerolata TaxID=185951 RepID=UPI002FE129DA